ncbi:GDYXXLXY domain-containing protein [Paraflavitalea sp. CAU 1676]|uniref:GDYXXLXY domain-containing protein n=1 Tax=Paraflavitalea sp. CAU 1676 TaxID=3032598 RepID=UPI0023DB7538|nr:GDYXXLXY domain-containing protein [Paraflavitalea sp. CAU 1676]MDF2188630.1 GDYXXLXY domain-containing protein [Paraflavitalea sp. CAU 1676]
MKKYKIILIVVNLVIVLGFFHFTILQKEKILDKGKLVLLRLEPVDPRSLMQGDYMDLRYEIATVGDRSDFGWRKHSRNSQVPTRGFCVVTLDSGLIARYVRVQKKRQPLNAGEYLIEYSTTDHYRIDIGAESYFFEEGKADKYDKAKFGGLRVDDKGNSVLVGLYDEQKRLIQ